MYEFTMNFSYVHLVKLLFILLPIGVYYFSNVFEKLILKIAAKTVAIIILCLAIGVLVEPFYNYFRIKALYDNDNLQVVEGYVDDFKSPSENDLWGGHTCESFYVNDVYFEYTNYASYGYCTYAEQGGIIQKEGQYVRIKYYTSYGENIICYIETIEQSN